MSIVRNVLSAGLLCAAAVSAQTSVNLDDPVILDDFNDVFTGSSPQQCNIGEVYGMTLGSAAYEGGGYWYMFADTNGSSVTNKDGDPIVSGSNEVTMIPDGSFYAKLSSSTSTEEYPYAGIGCQFTGTEKSEDYLDLSKMTKITMKIKGSGKVRMHLETKDIKSKGYTWGWYGKEITIPSSWTEMSIPVSDLKPEQYSDPEKNSMTWSDGKSAVYKISFQTKKADAVLELDDIKFVGVTYNDLRFPAAKVINLRAPKTVSGFSVNGSVVSFNLPKAQNLSVTLTDMMGNTVSTLFSGVASSKSIAINDKHLSSGKYLVVAKGKNINFSESIVISK